MEDKDKKPSKFFIIYLLIFITILAVFINPVSRRYVYSFLNTFNKSEKELKLVNSFNIDKQTKDIGVSGENIISWRDNKLCFLDFNGFETLNKDFKFNNPSVVFGENNIYIMDKNSGNIHVLDKSGDIKEKIDFKDSFDRFKEEGDFLCVYKKDEDIESIDILDIKGNILISHEENMPILTTALENNKKYLVSILDMDKELKSMVGVYSIDGNNILEIELKDEIVLYTKLIKNNVLIATENKIYVFVEGKEKWSKEIKDLKDIKVSDSNILILYDNKFEKINLRGNTVEKKTLDVNFKHIVPIDKKTLLYGKKNIIILKNERNMLNFKTKGNIIDLKYNNGNLIIQKEDKIEIYDIVKKGDKK